MLPGRLGLRFALEALFLVLLAIGAGNRYDVGDAAMRSAVNSIKATSTQAARAGTGAGARGRVGATAGAGTGA